MRITTFIACASPLLVFSTAAAAQNEIRFSDLMGNEVVLDAPADSIVTIVIPAAGDTIALDQSTARLSGVNPSSRRQLEQSILGEVLPEVSTLFDGIISGGGTFTPNVEAIAALAPDVVIQWGTMGDDLTMPLENAGLTIARYSAAADVLESGIVGVTMLGAMTGNPDRADALNDWRRATLEAVQERSAAIAPEERLRVAAFSIREDGFGVSGADTGAGIGLELAGGINVANEFSGLRTVSAEQIAAWDPDVIFVYLSGAPEDVLAHPVLSLTSAGQAGRVWQVPAGATTWSATSGPETPLYWLWAQDVLYPDTGNHDLRAQAAQWLAFMYGATLTDDQLDRILALSANAGLASAEGFAAR